MKELEEKTSEEALLLAQKKHDLWRYQNERDEARRLQGSGSSRRMKKDADSQDLFSFESCRSSAVDHVEEMSLESPRKMQEEQEVMRENSGDATRGRGHDAWRLADYVREANDMNQEEAEETSFVPSAISLPQKPFFVVTISAAKRPSASAVCVGGDKGRRIYVCQQCYNKSLEAKGGKPLTKWKWYAEKEKE